MDLTTFFIKLLELIAAYIVFAGAITFFFWMKGKKRKLPIVWVEKRYKWIGLFTRDEKIGSLMSVRTYVCLLPCLPIHFIRSKK